MPKSKKSVKGNGGGKSLADMTELELREYEVPWPKSQKELIKIIGALTTRDHDYGTCVYAMSIASVAAFNYIAHKLGVTGFQASAADLDFLSRTRSLKHGFKIVDYGNMLYPQYEDYFTAQTVTPSTLKALKGEAKKLLKEQTEHTSPCVIEHWKGLAAGHAPFGLVVSDD